MLDYDLYQQRSNKRNLAEIGEDKNRGSSDFLSKFFIFNWIQSESSFWNLSKVGLCGCVVLNAAKEVIEHSNLPFNKKRIWLYTLLELFRLPQKKFVRILRIDLIIKIDLMEVDWSFN